MTPLYMSRHFVTQLLFLTQLYILSKPKNGNGGLRAQFKKTILSKGLVHIPRKIIGPIKKSLDIKCVFYYHFRCMYSIILIIVCLFL